MDCPKIVPPIMNISAATFHILFLDLEDKTPDHSSLSVYTQTKFGTLWFLDFWKRKIAVYKKLFLDHGRDEIENDLLSNGDFERQLYRLFRKPEVAHR